MMEFAAKTVREAWLAAIRHILTEGRKFIDDDGRECHEVANLSVTIENPASAAEGVRAMRLCRKWRYPSEDELANIILNKEAGSSYDYLYGQRIFAYAGTVDQVDDYVIPLLKARPNSRRAVVSLLNPALDLKSGSTNLLGIALIHFRILDGKVDVTTVIRTSGFFTGWPANIFQIAQLQERVALALQLPQGRITTISLAAHIHTENLEDIEIVLGKDVVKDAKE